MFEKEANEYAKENKGVYGSDEYADITDYNNVKKAFQKGAEFGFQKGLKTKVNTTTIPDYPIKEDEWHFTKDGEYPKEHQLVLLYRENPNGANVALSYWYKSYVNDKVIAWKEVIAPTEVE